MYFKEWEINFFVIFANLKMMSVNWFAFTCVHIDIEIMIEKNIWLVFVLKLNKIWIDNVWKWVDTDKGSKHLIFGNLN